jgi:hypothetical protein
VVVVEVHVQIQMQIVLHGLQMDFVVIHFIRLLKNGNIAPKAVIYANFFNINAHHHLTFKTLE